MKSKTKTLLKVVSIVIVAAVIAVGAGKLYNPTTAAEYKKSASAQTAEATQKAQKNEKPIPTTTEVTEEATTSEAIKNEVKAPTEPDPTHLVTDPSANTTTEPATEPTTAETTAPNTIPTTLPTTTTSPAKPTSDSELSAMEMQAFNMLNAFRKENGVKPLAWESACHSAAKTRAYEASQKWSHTRPDGSSFATIIRDMEESYIYGALGENLCMNFYTLEAAMDSLKNSEGHRRNMLDSEFDAVSIGIYPLENGKFVLCQLFMEYA